MNPDLGDSAIVETYGLGALAVAASPLGRARRSGIDARGRRAHRRRAAAASRPACRPTSASPTGAPAILGIDARKVAATRISPPVHTGIAHRQPGIGQIGGGITHPPLVAFDEAVEALG